MKKPKLLPVKSKRCSMALEFQIENEQGVRQRRPKGFMKGAWTFKLRSPTKPAVCVLQVFITQAWNKSRDYRALMLRHARRELAGKVNAANA